jgi:hypothetical protein
MPKSTISESYCSWIFNFWENAYFPEWLHFLIPISNVYTNDLISHILKHWVWHYFKFSLAYIVTFSYMLTMQFDPLTLPHYPLQPESWLHPVLGFSLLEDLISSSISCSMNIDLFRVLTSSCYNFIRLHMSRNLSISSIFTKLLEYKFLKYPLMIPWISVASVAYHPSHL